MGILFEFFHPIHPVKIIWKKGQVAKLPFSNFFSFLRDVILT